MTVPGYLAVCTVRSTARHLSLYRSRSLRRHRLAPVGPRAKETGVMRLGAGMGSSLRCSPGPPGARVGEERLA